jgi:hypothetical protein
LSEFTDPLLTREHYVRVEFSLCPRISYSTVVGITVTYNKRGRTDAAPASTSQTCSRPDALFGRRRHLRRRRHLAAALTYDPTNLYRRISSDGQLPAVRFRVYSRSCCSHGPDDGCLVTRRDLRLIQGRPSWRKRLGSLSLRVVH